jgi:O-antigen/teichoic acid export membrane protein
VAVSKKIAGGVAWMMLFRVAERLLGIVSTLLLVRLLLPGDFGIVAMATAIIAAVEVLGAFSFDTVLIQRRDATRAHYDTAWTFNVLVATGIALVLLALAVPAAEFYKEPRLTDVVLLLAAGSFVGGFENIGVVDFRKGLRFDKEFRFLLLKKLVSFAVVVPLAFALRSYWALVISIVVSKVSAVAISYFAHPFRPRLSLAEGGELVKYSKWLFMNNLILLARDRSADLAVGRMVGSHALGLYSVAQEVSTLPTQFVAPVNRAVFPGYASQAGDLGQLRQSFLDVTSFVWFLAMPAGIGIAVIAPVLVPVVLGTNWLEAIPVVTILALAGTPMVMESNVAYVFYALGKPRVTTIMMISYVVMLIPLMIVLTRNMGAVGAAWAHLVTAMIFVPASFIVVLRYLRLPMRRFLAAVGRIVVSTAVMAGAVIALLGNMTGAGMGQTLSLVLAVLAGVGIYAFSTLVLWFIAGRPAGVERTILGIIRKRLRRQPAAAGVAVQAPLTADSDRD